MVGSSILLPNAKAPQPLRLRPEYLDNSYKNECNSGGSILFIALNCFL